MSAAPTLAEAITATKKKLDLTLCLNCTIQVHHALNEALIQTILQVDAYKFRKELQYRQEEVLEHANNPGFILITAECDGQPLGIVYGYDEPDSGFFLDTLASMVEGKGIGHTLATLIIIHAQNHGYKHVTLYTEEQDEMGRLLRRFYQKMGFAYLGTEADKGDVMKLPLTPQTAPDLLNKYIGTPTPTPTVNKNIPQTTQPIQCNS
jgi:ribosomal protein S18 acetylase RimI-like enzyme